MDDHKEKSKHRTRQSPINFVVPMQLEEIIHLANRPSTILHNLDVYVSQRIDDDHAEFVATFYEMSGGKRSPQVAVYTTGMLYRWEGTSTQFRGMFILRDGTASVAYSLLTLGATFLLLILSTMFLLLLIMYKWHLVSIVSCGCGAYYLILLPLLSLERRIYRMYLRRYIANSIQQYFTTASL